MGCICKTSATRQSNTVVQDGVTANERKAAWDEAPSTLQGWGECIVCSSARTPWALFLPDFNADFFAFGSVFSELQSVGTDEALNVVITDLFQSFIGPSCYKNQNYSQKSLR